MTEPWIQQTDTEVLELSWFDLFRLKRVTNCHIRFT